MASKKRKIFGQDVKINSMILFDQEVNISEMILLPKGMIQSNPGNPRLIKDDKFRKLVKSIKSAPWMLTLRPIIVDEDGIILGGNMRFRAAVRAGLKEIPIQIAINLSEEEKSEFIVKDNVGFGEWDWDILANEWDQELLTDWGLDLPLGNEKDDHMIQGDEEFAEFLDEEHNYVVLYFDNRINWLQALTHFKLKEGVYAKRTNGKKWAKGIGRVIDGAEYLKKQHDDEL
jgi:hypothetical protein